MSAPVEYCRCKAPEPVEDITHWPLGFSVDNGEWCADCGLPIAPAASDARPGTERGGDQ